MKDFLAAIEAARIVDSNIKHEGGIRWRVSSEREIAVLKDILFHHDKFTYIKEKSSYEADSTVVMFKYTSGSHLLIVWYKTPAPSPR